MASLQCISLVIMQCSAWCATQIATSTEASFSCSQAFINKHDYARLHSYEFHSYPVLRNRTAAGTWYRLQIIKQVPLLSLLPQLTPSSPVHTSRLRA